MKETSDESTAGHEVKRRRGRYLVGVLPQHLLPAGVRMATPDTVFEQLGALPDVTLHRKLRAPAADRGSPLSDGTTPLSQIAVFEMSEERAVALNQTPELLIEPDLRLQATRIRPKTLPNPATVVPVGRTVRLSLRIRGSDGIDLSNATVLVQGRVWPVQGMTGGDGRVSLTLVTDTASTIQSIYVKPAYGYWNRWFERPQLSANGDNVIVLERLDRMVPDFPARQSYGWGQRAMRLDRIPPTYRGDGVKIAIIDSGADIGHPDLKDRVTAGLDLVGRTPQGWATDEVGHGTHCAGIITSADNGHGIIGFAPGAEVHACKIFPGGRFSDFIEALDYCIEQKIDVVNLSLGADGGSIFVARKIEEARLAGVACIVAAGNSAGPVQFPATLPTVLTVAAVGKTETYPADSHHATQVVGQPTQEGYFSASFTCFGPEVDVVAPGVAILSSVPGEDYAAWDGTSMATPHVTGLAALVLAHRADFQQQFANPAERVQRLFDVIQGSCQPLPDLGPGRAGAGLPDAPHALGLAEGPFPVQRRPVVGLAAGGPADVETLLALLRVSMERAGLAPAAVQ